MRRWLRGLTGMIGMLAVLAGPGTAKAEWQYCSYSVNGIAELGARFFIERPSQKERGKFEEYRDMEPGVFLENLHLFINSQDEKYLYELRARNAGLDDQNFYLRASRIGLYDLEVEWDQIPHTYSTYSPLADKVETRRDTARFGFSYTPTPEVDLAAEYRFMNRYGNMVKGAAEEAFEFPVSGYEFDQFLEPIRYKDHDAKLSASLDRKWYQVQMSYSLSMFNNETGSALIEPGGSADDRVALPPDNMAHTLAAAGGVNLPYRTRLNSAFSYNLRLQNDDLLPDINGNRLSSGNGFDGQVNTFLYYLSGVSRPIQPLTLKAKYRLFHYDDASDLPDLEDNNAGISPMARRYPYTRHDASLEGKWKFDWPLTVSTSFGWQRWDRDDEVLEVGTTNDYTPKLTLDYSPFSWLSFGTSYSHSIRDVSNLARNGSQAFGPTPPPPPHPQRRDCASCHSFGPPGGQSAGQNPLLNRFNMAPRDRDQMDFFMDLTPLETLTWTTTVSYANDDFRDSSMGLLDDSNWSIGTDICWRPMERLALNASYVHEEFDAHQKADDLIDIDPGPTLTTHDRVETVGIGLNWKIIQKKLDFDARWNLSFAQSDFHNRALPDLEDTMSQYKTYFTYHFQKNWLARVGYIFETFDITNNYAHNLGSEPGGTGSRISAEEYYRDYDAHMIVFNIGYQF